MDFLVLHIFKNRPPALLLASALAGTAVAGAMEQPTKSVPVAQPTPAGVKALPAGSETTPAASRGATRETTPGATTRAAEAPSTQQAAEPKITCRTEKTTGSRLQSRKVCSTPDSNKGSADWVREQQTRGAIGASAIVNRGQ